MHVLNPDYVRFRKIILSKSKLLPSVPNLFFFCGKISKCTDGRFFVIVNKFKESNPQKVPICRSLSRSYICININGEGILKLIVRKN